MQIKAHIPLRRGVSMVLACAVLAVTLLSVLPALLFSSAEENGLNTAHPVQCIDLSATDTSRTSVLDSNLSLSVAEDSFTLSSLANGKGQSMAVSTTLGQKINLAQNPYLYLKWSGNAACNGQLIVTLTKNGVKSSRELTLYYSSIVEFNEGNELTYGSDLPSSGECAADMVKYLYAYLEKNGGLEDWPDWTHNGDDQNYITIERSVQTLNGTLTTDSYTCFETCSLGRLVLSSPATMLPSTTDDIQVITGSAENARMAIVENEGLYLRNVSDSETITFRYAINRYVSVAALQSLVAEMSASGDQSSSVSVAAAFGGLACDYLNEFITRGALLTLDQFGASRSADGGYALQELDAYTYFQSICVNSIGRVTDSGDPFYPDDGLVDIRRVEISVPAGVTICLKTLEFREKNVEAAAVGENESYPWAASDEPQNEPTEGSPASEAGTAYEWATSAQDALEVQSKIDLLSIAQYGETDGGATLERYPTDSEEHGLLRATVTRLGDDDYRWQTFCRSMTINLQETPYLYYSYKSNGEAFGLSLDVGEDATYYLDSQGITLFARADEQATDYRTQTAQVRTGCISLEKLRLDAGYDAATDTVTISGWTLHLLPQSSVDIYYLYIGSAPLQSTVTDFAKADGDAFSWAVSPTDFYNNETVTLAQKVDLLNNMTFCKGVYGTAAYAINRSDGLGLDSDGIYRMATAGVMDAWNGFQVIWKFDLSENASARYLYYSVEADPGMSWTLWLTCQNGAKMILVHDGASSRMICYSGNDVTTLWTPSGNENGCVELPTDTDFDWSAVSTMHLYAFSPDKKTADGSLGQVNVQYICFGSAPISKSDEGTPSVTAQTMYSWQATTDPTLTAKIDLLDRAKQVSGNTAWYSGTKIGGSGSSLNNLTIDTYQTPYLYYSMSANAAAGMPSGSGRATFILINSNGVQYSPLYDAPLGEAGGGVNGIKGTSLNAPEERFIQGASTGCIDLRSLADNFYTDSSKRYICLRYLTIDVAETGYDYTTGTSYPLTNSVTINYLYIGAATVTLEQAACKDYNILTNTHWMKADSSGRYVVGHGYNSAGTWTSFSVITEKNEDFLGSTRDTYQSNVVNFVNYTTNSASAFNWWDNIYFAEWTYLGADDTPYSLSQSTASEYQYLWIDGRAYTNTDLKWSVRLIFTNFDDSTQQIAYTLDPNNLTILQSLDSTGSDPGAENYIQGSRFFYIDLVNSGIDLSTYRLTHVGLFRGGSGNSDNLRLAMYSSKDVQTSGDYAGYTTTSGVAPSFTFVERASDFSGFAYETTVSRTVLLKERYIGWGAQYSSTVSNHVNLVETPYLYYSFTFASGGSGTFCLQTDKPVNGLSWIYRDESSDEMLSAASDPTSVSESAYMVGAENGCINVKAWYNAAGYADSELTDVLISQFYMRTAYWGTTVDYFYFGTNADRTIDLIPADENGCLDSGVVTYASTSDDYVDQASNISTEYLGKGDSAYNRLQYTGGGEEASYYAINYGVISDVSANRGSTDAVLSEQNVTTGLAINLNSTPYLHYSISQEEGSYTFFVLQIREYTDENDYCAIQEVRPWLSASKADSPAGQLVQLMSGGTSQITYYKDAADTSGETGYLFVSGDMGGVIDLRNWYTQINGCSSLITLERVRFYTVSEDGVATAATVNQFYLGSAAGAAYTVTFDRNYDQDESVTRSTKVLQNANEQYVQDDFLPTDFTVREGYTFVGWYTDPDWDTYFDLTNTPITSDLHLYAGWIDNEKVETGEVVDWMPSSAEQVSVSGGVSASEAGDGDALTLTAGDAGGTASWTVNKAYSLKALSQVLLGFDTAQTAAVSVSATVKNRGTYAYELLSFEAFADEKTADGALEAGPYDRTLALYSHMASIGRLPGDENPEVYIYVKSVQVTLPAGASIAVRYCRSVKTAQETTEKIAAVSNALDLAAQSVEIQYPGILSEKSDTVSVYNSDDTYTSTLIQGTVPSFVSYGNVYGIGDPVYEEIDLNETPYLYYSITQPQDSYTTFSLYVAGTNQPDNWLVFYDAREGALVNQTHLINGSIVQESYIQGSQSGVIDLREWFAENDGGTSTIELRAFRFYTSGQGTDATFDYFVIGGETAQYTPTVVYTDADGAQTVYSYSARAYGEDVGASLTDLPDALLQDATTAFEGWSLSENGSLLYWNPNASNTARWSEDNPNGAWAIDGEDGFACDAHPEFQAALASVTYQFTEQTQTLYPRFTKQTTVSLTLQQEGEGSVSLACADSSGEAGDYTVSYGAYAVLSASGDDFGGWYDETGACLSTDKELILRMTADTAVTARFGESSADAAASLLPSGQTTVWLKGAAGLSYSLQAVSNGTKLSPIVSQAADGSQIACYWNIDAAQLLKAVAPQGYHWAQLLQSGEMVDLGEREYTFIAAVNVRLLCIADGAAQAENTVTINEFSVLPSREQTTVRFTVDWQLTSQETLVSCGLLARSDEGVLLLGTADASVLTARAWNANTQQYQVEFTPTCGERYTVRAYAIVYEADSGRYTVRYGDTLAVSV